MVVEHEHGPEPEAGLTRRPGHSASSLLCDPVWGALGGLGHDQATGWVSVQDKSWAWGWVVVLSEFGIWDQSVQGSALSLCPGSELSPRSGHSLTWGWGQGSALSQGLSSSSVQGAEWCMQQTHKSSHLDRWSCQPDPRTCQCLWKCQDIASSALLWEQVTRAAWGTV